MKVRGIVAVAHNQVIGDGKALLWNHPEDLKRFKRLTLGDSVIMGRNTFDSLPKPLSGRLNIVVTSRDIPDIPGVIKATSVKKALDAAKKFNNLSDLPRECWVIGGASIYKQAMPHISSFEITVVPDKVEGSVKFPGLSGMWKCSRTEAYSKLIFQTWDRVK